jgi:two-component system response regulator NreC
MSIPSSNAPRIILADDHEMVRDGLRLILKESGFDIVGQACDGQEAVRLAQTIDHDILVLDISMPVLNGIDAARRVLEHSPREKILILTMYTDDRYIRASLRLGVSGFLLKSKAASYLVEAIRSILSGEVYLCPTVAKVMADRLVDIGDRSEDSLSEREREVLQLIAEGKNSTVIGQHLGVTSKAVDSRRARIMEKLRIHDVAGLVRYAIREGLVHDPK